MGPLPSSPPPQNQVQNDIRRQESLLLNLWSSEAFQGGMTALAVVVLIAVIVSSGPPPVDERCTLPWC
jgi:hypothetical protein